jgi:BirA family biotin operon repressor/biotin-[acetyl-CoA-carboxylase] ligase
LNDAAALPAWEGHPPQEWRERWRLPRLDVLESTGSTNDDVRAMAEAGAPAGFIVIAEHQTQGRGRLGRVWLDVPGDSLLFSVLLRPPPTDASAPGTAPIRVGIAIAEAIRSATGVDASLKWPNDIVHHDRKLAGVLCEAATNGGSAFIIAGIGINVRRRDWGAELRDTATSLESASGRTVSRAALMTAVVDALHPIFEASMTPLATAEIARYAALDSLRGRVVETTDPACPRGTARGIAADGALLLEHEGALRRITSATVRPVHPTPGPDAGARA